MRTPTAVYADILFCINLIIDYLMLLSVSRLLSLPARRIRLLSGAAVGGLGAMTLLLPGMPFLLTWTVNIAEAFLITAAAFLPLSARRYIRASVMLFVISFCYCGFMTAVMRFLSVENIVVNNGSVYIGISPFLLVGITIVCYFFMRILSGMMHKGTSERHHCRVRIDTGSRIVEADAAVDTGNTLHEPFSGECVIVGRADQFEDMIDADAALNGCVPSAGIRLIPYRSVGGSGVLPAFRPNRTVIITDGKETEVCAYIALCKKERLCGGADMLVPSELMMKGS